MSLDEFTILENGVITFRYVFPICPVCYREQPQKDRQFLAVFQCCQTCFDNRNQTKQEE